MNRPQKPSAGSSWRILASAEAAARNLTELTGINRWSTLCQPVSVDAV